MSWYEFLSSCFREACLWKNTESLGSCCCLLCLRWGQLTDHYRACIHVLTDVFNLKVPLPKMSPTCCHFPGSPTRTSFSRKFGKAGAGFVLRWWNTGLAHPEPWVPSPVPQREKWLGKTFKLNIMVVSRLFPSAIFLAKPASPRNHKAKLLSAWCR